MKLIFFVFCIMVNLLLAERREIEITPQIQSNENDGGGNDISSQKAAYLRAMHKEAEFDEIMKNFRSTLEILQHEVEIVRKNLDRLNSNMSLEVLRLREEIEKLKKIKSSNVREVDKKTITEKSGKKNKLSDTKTDPADNKALALSKNINKIKKDKEGKIIDQREELKKIKSLILNKKYLIATTKLDELIINMPKSEIISYFYYYKGVCCYNQGKYEEASFNFSESYNRNKNGPLAPNSLHKLAMCFKTQGQNQKAKVVLDKLKMDFPEYKQDA